MSANKGRVLWINGQNHFLLQLKASSLGAFTGLDFLEGHWDGLWDWGEHDESGNKVIVPTSLMEWKDGQ